MRLKTLSNYESITKEDPLCCACHFINEEHSRNYPRFLHSHKDFLELFYVYSGTGKYVVDSTAYDVSEGDIVICNAGVLHGDSLNGNLHMSSYCAGIKNVQFRGLPENWISPTEELPIVSCGHLKGNVREIFQLIYRLTDKGTKPNAVCDSLCKALIQLTIQLIQTRDLKEPSDESVSAHAIAERVRLYLIEHSHESLTLSDIASALNLNKYYLSHVFKDEYGMPPIQYSIERRIGEAQGYLIDSSIPIGDISEMLGFSTPPHFNYMFSKYVGISPGKYRESFKEMQE